MILFRTSSGVKFLFGLEGDLEMLLTYNWEGNKICRKKKKNYYTLFMFFSEITCLRKFQCKIFAWLNKVKEITLSCHI